MSGSAVKKPRLTKEEKTIVCKTGYLRASRRSRVIYSSGSNSSSTSTLQDLSPTSPAQERSDGLAPREWCRSPSKIHNNDKKRDDNRDSDDRLRDLPWMVGGVNRIWRTQKCTRTHFSGLRFGTSYESGIKIKEALYLYSLPKRPKWRSLHANQHDKGSLQKTHWRSSTSSRKVWWLDNGWSQSPRWGMWIKRQSPERCRGSRSCHSMDSVLCVHKTSQETEESSRKFLEQSQKPKVVYTANSLDFGKACEDLSWNHCSSTPHRSETNGIAERAVRRVKEGTSAVLLRSGIRSGQRMVGRFHGMLYLSAKHSRSLVWWENSIRKTFWETF